METLWQSWVIEPLKILIREVGLFLPKLFLFFVLLILGFAVGWVLKKVVVWVLVFGLVALAVARFAPRGGVGVVQNWRLRRRAAVVGV